MGGELIIPFVNQKAEKGKSSRKKRMRSLSLSRSLSLARAGLLVLLKKSAFVSHPRRYHRRHDDDDDDDSEKGRGGGGGGGAFFSSLFCLFSRFWSTTLTILKMSREEARQKVPGVLSRRRNQERERERKKEIKRWRRKDRLVAVVFEVALFFSLLCLRSFR